MNTNDPRFELIRRCRDGEASAEELAQLDSLLREDADFREAYVRYINLDVALGAVAKTVPMPVTSITPSHARRNVWLSWRPLTAAAAGLVIGAFSATAVWAFASASAPRLHERELPLVDGGFEQSAGDPPLYMPRKSGFWAGDPAAVVSESQGIKPRSGQRMLRYMSSAMSEELRAPNNASDLWQVIPLPGSGDRVVRIRAWFNAVGSASFTLAAVAGADGPESVVTLWKDRAKEDPKVLAAGMKRVGFAGETPGWKMAELLLQVPGPARVLVIDVAAHRMPGVNVNGGFPGQFVDDVSVTIADELALP